MYTSKRDTYFHNLLGLKWHIQTGGNAVLSGQQKQQNVPAGCVIKVVAARLAWTMPCCVFKWSLRVYEPMDLNIKIIGKDNEIFSSH